MHDPTAVLAITDPDLFTFEETGLSVVTEGPRIGQTVRAASGHPHRVCLGAQTELVRQRFLDIVGEADNRRAARQSLAG